jgi:hypothetical protein
MRKEQNGAMTTLKPLNNRRNMADISTTFDVVKWIALAGMYALWFVPGLLLCRWLQREYGMSNGILVFIWFLVPVFILILIDIFSGCGVADKSTCSVFGNAALWIVE